MSWFLRYSKKGLAAHLSVYGNLRKPVLKWFGVHPVCEDQDEVESDAEEVTMSKIIRDLFNISMCLVFNFIGSERD